jgi:WD40 repeat protein
MLAFAASSRTGFFTEEEEYETIIQSTQEERQRTLVFPGGRYLTASALSDDGALLATSRYLGTNTDRPTQIDLSISRGERRDARFGSSLRIVEMDFSPDGRLLACVGPDGFTVWDFEHGESILAKPGASGSDIAFSPHQETLAVAVGESVAIWDIVDGHQCALLEGQAGPVQCLDFSADGAILASGGAAGTVDLWDLNEGRLVQTYDWRIGSVSAIAFARDGLTCAAGGADGCIVVWDVDAQ